MIVLAIAVAIASGASFAQTSAPTGITQEQPANNLNTAALRDHIALDVALSVPLGSVADKLDLGPGWGFNLHFWKGLSSSTFGLVSVGNSWFQMGTQVETDSGIQDLSNYSLTVSPLLGGIGQIVPIGGDLSLFVAIHAGASIIDVKEGTRTPIGYIEDNTYFTVAGSAGLSYPVSSVTSLLFSTRYMHLFDTEFASFSIAAGASFHW